MKINEVMFYGFTSKEREQIKKETGKTGEEEFTTMFVQDISDIVGFDVLTLIQPGGAVSLIKAGE